MFCTRYTPFLFLSILLCSACDDGPEFPPEPRLIRYDGGLGEGIRFKDMPNTVLDSLIIRVVFEDGDGNLGLVSNEPDERLREPFFLVTDKDGNYTHYDPIQEPDYDCTRYTAVSFATKDTAYVDTLLVEFNQYYYNFEVDLLVEDNGVFKPYTPPGQSCPKPLGGRFSPLKDDFSNTKPLEGVIEYGFTSAILLGNFRNETLKLAVRIRDRSFNESNVLESKPFTLRGIEVPVDR